MKRLSLLTVASAPRAAAVRRDPLPAAAVYALAPPGDERDG